MKENLIHARTCVYNINYHAVLTSLASRFIVEWMERSASAAVRQGPAGRVNKNNHVYRMYQKLGFQVMREQSEGYLRVLALQERI